MPMYRKMQFILHVSKKVKCGLSLGIIVKRRGIYIRYLLIELAFAGTNLTNLIYEFSCHIILQVQNDVGLLALLPAHAADAHRRAYGTVGHRRGPGL